MIEKIYITILICCISFSSSEQASIVYDPTNGAQLANVLTTMQQLKKVNEQWKASAAFLNKVMKEGKEVKRLIALLDGMLCATDEMSMYLGMSSSQLICEKKIQMDIALGKIDGVSSRIKMIATGAIVLSQYETITSLKELNDQLQEAVQATTSLNAYLRRSFQQHIQQQDDEENGYLNVSQLTRANI